MLLPHALARTARRVFAVAVVCATGMIGAAAQGGPENNVPGRSQPRQQPHTVPQAQPQRGRGGFGQPQGPHLPQWFQQRMNLSPEQRQQELRREPGFQQMTPENQRRAVDGLQKLNSMTPEQQRRMLARNELMERLSPDQRRQFRGAMESYKTLTPERRGIVARSFRELRALPPQERAAALNSPQYRSRLSEDERRNLGLILSVEPPAPSGPPQGAPGYPYGHP